MAITEVDKLLNDKKKLLTEIYFDLQRYYEEKYGENTVVLMEVGTFFEVYEVDNEEMKLGKAKEISEVLNIQLTRKSKAIPEINVKNPNMAGVPAVALERYLGRIIAEEKYTVVLVRQKGVPPKITRYIDTIISPGTNFDFVQDRDENYLTSLLVDQNNGIYSIGYSAIDVTTGKTVLYESHGSSEDKTYALDEVFNLLSANRTKEVVLTFVHEKIDKAEVIRYLEIDTHYNYVMNKQGMKLAYQNELFKEVYRIESLLSPIEFLDLERSPLVSESLAVLIDFIISHDFNIVQKLSRPKRLKSQRYMYFGNSAPEQLGIVSKDKEEFTLLRLIDKTATPMGKRLLKERLLHPIMDKEELTRRYGLSKKVGTHIDFLSLELRRIYDLERLSRRMELGRLHPCEVNYLHSSLLGVREIADHFKRIKKDLVDFDLAGIDAFIDEIERLFNLELTAKFNYNQIDENIFNFGTDRQIDVLVEKDEELHQGLERIRAKILEILKAATDGKVDESYVMLGQLDKEGHYLSLTKNRYTLIEKELLKERVVIDGTSHFFEDFTIKKQTSNVKITADVIDEISKQIVNNQLQLIALVKEKFLALQYEFEKKYAELLDQLTGFVADIDVACSNMKTAQQYNYTEPQIVTVGEDENFLELLELRHPLIAAKEEFGIYVPNDMVLGTRKYVGFEGIESAIQKAGADNDVTGVLLYGINSSGKSSLMKSVGIAVIMAQAGFYVPAKEMRFALFESLFTRIVSKDNLSKGLSTFAVEMLELKNIFNRAGKKSLILGDEISHGTETLSGVAIVSSAIMKLSDIGSLFLFATHLHQLESIDEVKKLKNLVSMHLAVSYDKASDRLVFNRKLAAGSGSTLYGLEFARWLHMDAEFLANADDIRKKLANDYHSIETLSKKKKRSKYNKDLYLVKCSICGEDVDDTHHIAQQKDAGETGHVGHFHKDHRYNLIPLCKKHHDMVHDGRLRINGFVMTDKGLELHYHEEE